MGLFEFIMVIMSIIIGLGIAELLSGLARTLQHRASVHIYWVHLLLTSVVFLALIQQFWEAWSLRDVSGWTIGGLLHFLGAPICLYLCAKLLFPDETGAVDFEKHYYGDMRPVWLLLGLANILATTFRPIAFEESLVSVDNATSLIFLIAVPLLWLSQNRIAHALAVSVALVLVLGDIVIWTGEIES